MGQHFDVPTLYLRFASVARPLVLDPKCMYKAPSTPVKSETTLALSVIKLINKAD